MDRTLRWTLAAVWVVLLVALLSTLAVGNDSLFRAIALLLIGLASFTAALRARGGAES